MIQLRFLGANRQVTGSRYCLEIGSLKMLVDCGLFQERPFVNRNWEPCPLPAGELDAILLTHAHIDHCGLIPRLVREGFRGPVYCTRPSAELAEVLLRDAAQIQVEDARLKKKRHRKEGRRGKYPEVPLFAEPDVEQALPLFQGVGYGAPVELRKADGQVTALFREAGHILGSAFLELDIQHDNQTTRILFSGDLGQQDKPLIRDPDAPGQADYVVMETTYGDRDHPDHDDVEGRLEQVILETVQRGGNVVIPTFAVERAQDLVYYIGRLLRAQRIPQLDVFLDSPMAVDVTDIFRHHHDCFDEEAWNLIASREPPLRFPNLRMVRSVAESKAINDHREPCIIMATSGMCTAGRIKHHLRANIERPESTILFVGYQAHGTLGRQILDGNELVRIHGRQWKVQARVDRIEGFSGHADRAGLLRWVGRLQTPPRHVFLTHGDEEASRGFAGLLRESLQWDVSVPEYGQVVDLGTVGQPD